MAAVVSRWGLLASLNTLVSTPRLVSVIDGVNRSAPTRNRAESAGSASSVWADARAAVAARRRQASAAVDQICRRRGKKRTPDPAEPDPAKRTLATARGWPGLPTAGSRQLRGRALGPSRQT